MIRPGRLTAALSLALICSLAILLVSCGGTTPNSNGGNSSVAKATPTGSPSTSPSPTPSPLPCDAQINRNLYNAIRAVPALKAQMNYFTGWSENCRVILKGYVETDALYVQVINVASGVRDNSNNRIQGLDVLNFVSHREAYLKLHPEAECATDEQRCGQICIKLTDQCWPGSGGTGTEVLPPTPTPR